MNYILILCMEMSEMIGKNKPRIRTKEQEKLHQQKRRANVKYLVLSHYGINNKPLCVNCGFDDIRALTIDHVFNDGGQQRKMLPETRGSCFYPWLKKHKFPVGYQTLCMNCQFIKRDEVYKSTGGKL